MRIIIALVLLAASTSAQAKQEYAAYEGLDAIQQGRGGTKVTKNGIDYWTTGAPPRRFKVLGYLTDARKDRLLDGNVIGSKSIAKIALDAGGDAVIVMGASTAAAGVVNFADATAQGNSAQVFGYGKVINRTTTQMAVIKYLEE